MALDRQTALRRFTDLVRSRRDQLHLNRLALAKKTGANLFVLHQVENRQADKVDCVILVRIIERLKMPSAERDEAYSLIPVFLSMAVSPPPKNLSGRQLRR